MKHAVPMIAVLLIAFWSCQSTPKSDSHTEDIQAPTTRAPEGEITNSSLEQPDQRGMENVNQGINESNGALQPAAKAMDFRGFREFFEPHVPTLQEFTIDANKDMVIEGEHGTRLKMAANSLVNEATGEAIKGKVRIRLQEFYDAGDFLKASLSTQSGNELLETGGTIFVEAYAGKQRCQLKPGTTMEISFPYEEEKQDMALYLGQWENDEIDWVLNTQQETENETESRNTVYRVVEEMPYYPGGEKALKQYISTHLETSFEEIEGPLDGTIYTELTINNSGRPQDIKVIRGVDPIVDQALISIIEKMPDWSPGYQNGQPVNAIYVLPVHVMKPDDWEPGQPMSEKDMAAAQLNKIKKKDGVGFASVTAYVLNTTSLGWINCDRMYQYSGPRADLLAKFEHEQVDLNMIFHDLNSVLNARRKGKKLVFKNIPLNMDVTVIAMKFENNQYYMAKHEHISTSRKLPVFEFEAVTARELVNAADQASWN